MRRTARPKTRPPNVYELLLDATDGSAFDFVLPLPDRVFRAIGHVLCQWAYFEQGLNEDLLAVGHSATSPTDPNIMSRSFRKRLAQWERIFTVEFASDAEICEVARLCSAARALKEPRDLLSHGTWGVGDEGATLSTYKFGRFQDLVDHDLGAESIEQVARQISALNARIFRLRSLWGRRHAVPQPQPLE